MATYSIARHEVPPLVSEIIEGHYPDLAEAGVTVTCMLAHADLDRDGVRTGPALKLHGYPAAAIMKINSAKDRAEGKADATLTVDGDEWTTWTDHERLARVHHEIHHLTVLRDDDGEILLDKALRPRLKLRLHDLVLGGFAEIAKLYGEDSGEAAQAESIPLRHVQLLWSFADADHEPRSGRRSSAGRRKAAMAGGAAGAARSAMPSGTPQDAATAPLEGQGVLIDDLDQRDDLDGQEAPEAQDGLQGDPGDVGFDAGSWAEAGTAVEVGA